MDIVTILIVVGISAAFVAFMGGQSTGRGLDAFAAGFLPYREAGWPRGVQEGEPIPWKWSSMRDRGVPPIDREVPPDTGAEVFEIDTTAAIDAELTGVDHGHISRGSSIRDV
jgi:hypothetical protein